MSDRHFELPDNPNLEYYRKRAKRLHREYLADDPEAMSRVADVLGERAAARFLLSDAQHVLAQEHGFRTWAEFRTQVESHTAEDRPVSRIIGLGVSLYEGMADTLLSELHQDRPEALRRLRAYVPRHASTTDGGTAELRDARLVIAGELGFPTWREFVSYNEKAKRDSADRKAEWRNLAPWVEALLAGDTGQLADLDTDQANCLLHMLALPETIGVRLDRELGVPRAGVDVLLAKADNLDLPLVHAAHHDRVEYARLLVAAGADPGSRQWGDSPLETAIYCGNTEVVDLLAAHAISPAALWTYAACGRLDLVRSCFDADSTLRPDAATERSNFAIVGMPPRLPATDDPREILGEAFVHACQHGRTEVVRWFLEYGVHPDTAPYVGQTGLHWAIPGCHVEVIRLLLERGADPSIRDEMLEVDADGWLHVALADRPHEAATEQIHDLIQSYRGSG